MCLRLVGVSLGNSFLERRADTAAGKSASVEDRSVCETAQRTRDEVPQIWRTDYDSRSESLAPGLTVFEAPRNALRRAPMKHCAAHGLSWDSQLHPHYTNTDPKTKPRY